MSLQKHLLNSSSTLVSESLQGLCAVNDQLAYDPSSQVVYKAKRDATKVSIICGGGSGHEPSHAGFVGEGMLTAAVCGNVFASPNASQVRRGIDLVENDAGNYTGDVLNFGLAKEQYAAESKNPNAAKFLVVGDDVAVGKTQGGIVGRRGLAGVVLVYKIAGALAARGANLDEVYSAAEYVASRIGTIGVGLEHCHVPGTATSSEAHLAADEIEIGLGIHNESGIKRVKPVPQLKALAPQLLDFIMSQEDKERAFLPFKGDGEDEVVLLVNNLGGLSELEVGGVVNAISGELKNRKTKIARVISGTFMTSLNMPGFSVSLVLLPRAGDKSPKSAADILSLLDAKADTPGWKWTSSKVPNASFTTPPSADKPAAASSKGSLAAADPKSFIAALTRACKAVAENEPEITRMDTIAGDGDCGLTLKAGAEGVMSEVESGNIKGADIIGDVVVIAKVAEKAMGGTSGALYSIFMSALAQGLKANATGDVVTDEIWKKALVDALAKLYTYTRARPPSRTLIDPLAAFVENLGQGFPALSRHTKDVEAKAGRSAYVDSSLLTKERVADPGAWGVKVILQALIL
ncbi:Dak1 domain-containing protein [Mucidula mucida]|nr:Dak1 domain-containing protein [Mucidula mucida]